MTIEKTIAPDRLCREAVAYDLMRDILFEDPKRPQASTPEFRAYVLDLYAECLAAVRGQRGLESFRPPRPASASAPPAAAVATAIPPLPVGEKPGLAAFERARSPKRRAPPITADA
jgi:hypothetical protein